jgi:hypothetical protein
MYNNDNILQRITMKYYFYAFLTILLAGCFNTEPKINLKEHTPIFQKGYKDGCRTAEGNYTKNHKLFNNNLDYHEGWFGGRKECNKS